MHNLNLIIPLATAISLVVTAITAVVSAIVGLNEYKLKVKSEIGQLDSSKAEIDVRVAQLFAEFMSRANGRGDGYISEKCVEELFEKGFINKEDFKTPDDVRDKWYSAAAVNYPVGEASQDAAIITIAILGNKYPILKESARAGLQSLRNIDRKKDVVNRAFEILENVPK